MVILVWAFFPPIFGRTESYVSPARASRRCSADRYGACVTLTLRDEADRPQY